MQPHYNHVSPSTLNPFGSEDHRLYTIESRLDELETLFAELADEFGSNLFEVREFHRHRAVLEAIVVQAFSLSSSADLYWREVKTRNIRTEYLPERRKEIVAAYLMIYYIMQQHNERATLVLLEKTYGYSRARFFNRFERQEDNPRLHAIRLDVERQFLDKIGRSDEPVTELDVEQGQSLQQFKEQCRSKGIKYRRSLYGQ